VVAATWRGVKALPDYTHTTGIQAENWIITWQRPWILELMKLYLTNVHTEQPPKKLSAIVSTLEYITG